MHPALLATLVAAASARLVAISAPAALAPNTSFTFNLTTQNYIQSVADLSVAWGFQLPSVDQPTGWPHSVGCFASSAYLGPGRSNQPYDVVVNGTVPVELNRAEWYGKDVVLSVAVTSLYGQGGMVVVYGWNVTVKIGETTGGVYVRSGLAGWSYDGHEKDCDTRSGLDCEV